MSSSVAMPAREATETGAQRADEARSVCDAPTFAAALLPGDPDAIQFGLHLGGALELNVDVPAALVQRAAHGVELGAGNGMGGGVLPCANSITTTGLIG